MKLAQWCSRASHVHRLAAAAVGMGAVAVVVAACGNSGDQGSASGSAPAPSPEMARYAAIKGPWLVWNKDACRFKVTDKHPTRYAAVLRRTDKPLKMVFTPYDTVSAASSIINSSVRSAVEKTGVQLTQISNEYPSVDKALTAADQAVATHPDAAISASIVAELYNRIQPKYEAACIPMATMFAFPTPHPSPGFQSSFKSEGNAMATAAIDIVKKRGWPPSQIWVLTCGEPKTSPGPGTLRDIGTTFRDRVAAAFDVPSTQISPILDCNQNGQGALDARTATTDWLTAHPQAKYVVGSFWVDSIAVGMAQALKARGFGDRALVAGGDASDSVVKMIAAGDPILQVDADKGFLKWGTYAVALAQDIAAGRPVPTYMDPGTTAVTPGNAAKILADRAALAKKFGR